MLKRTLVFSCPMILALKNQQLALFRKNLEKDGFTMHQFSVYIRYCGSLESAQVHIKRVKSFTPEKGHVSVLSITDKQ